MGVEEIEDQVQYREITGFTDYRIGSDGTSWSRNPRFKFYPDSIPWKQLKPTVKKGGYLATTLYRDKKQHRRMIQRLVLEAFVGPCPDGMEACHIDHDPTNNNLSNLEWGTHQDNMTQSVSAGRIRRGETSGKTSFTEQDILDIRAAYCSGELNIDIAKRLGKNIYCIRSINQGKAWKFTGGLPETKEERRVLALKHNAKTRAIDKNSIKF